MKLLDFLKRERKQSASVAKERLQIIVAHQRSQRGNRITCRCSRRSCWK